MAVISAKWVPMIIMIATAVAQNVDTPEEQRATRYIDILDRRTAGWWNKVYLATWNYEIDITKANEDIMNAAMAQARANEQKYYGQTLKFNWRSFTNVTLKRLFEEYAVIGNSALPADKAQLLSDIINGMQSNYATTKICDYFNKAKCDLVLENDIINLFSTSTNPDQLKDAFIQWHKLAGTKIKQDYTRYVTLKNEAAKLNGFASTAEWWLSPYDTTDIEKQLATIWTQLEPLYKQLHAYVRGRLRLRYGEKVVSKKGPIPAHLLGDIWGLTWVFLESITTPYPDVPDLNLTKAFLDQKYTPVKMFRLCDDFMKSMNLSGASDSFWQKSVFQKPTDGRDIDCHPTSFDFADGKDFRIVMCTELNYDYYVTMYHEMGHIQYFIQYANQPYGFRDGANPGFQASVGDALALSTVTPKYLNDVGLINLAQSNEKTEINFLLKTALDKVAFLPFGYLLDFYRYNIFRGKTTPDNYNCHYWHLKERLQGFEPPVPRTEEDFDGGAKYHMVADVDYILYYVGINHQFQFHKAMCTLAGEYEPNNPNKKLSDCSVYKSTAAGNAFKKMLSLGASKPWPDALEQLTGTRTLSADGILEYFKPLMDWLTAENKRTGEFIGWEPSTVQYCTAAQKAAGFPGE